MPREHNYLLGNGERLTSSVSVPKGGAQKKSPYDFRFAQKRMTSKLSLVTHEFSTVPANASPDGEVVAVLTMHPRYVSKSDSPQALLRSVGLQSVGSRARNIKPERWGTKKHPFEAVTDDLFVMGTRDAFSSWSQLIISLNEESQWAENLTHLEDIQAYLPKDKLRGIPSGKEEALFEIVMHNAKNRKFVDAFVEYAENYGTRVLKDRLRDVRGLTFIPVYAHASQVEKLAEFTLVRVARGMPSMRPFPTSIMRSASGFSVVLPKGAVLDTKRKAVIFDGGLSKTAQSALAPWVRQIEPAGIGPSFPEAEQHGLGVTSAFLFGPLRNGKELELPFCGVDHVRVLERRDSTNNDTEYLDVLDRVLKTLDGDVHYDFVNLSLGPNMAMDDDEVTAWTAELDQRFTGGKIIATVAAGNDGERDGASGLNRVQPPADGVNVLSVGAADSQGDPWKRACYSCIGPGRSPGVVKPDGVAFGGSSDEPFMILDDGLKAHPILGTSFAAPYVLRSAASIAVQSGSGIDALAVRALLVHRAEQSGNSKVEVGWGRFENDARKLITCDDNEAIVMYEGVLPVGQHLRASIPLPEGTLLGKIIVTATLVIAPDVDPENPGAYTRAGLEVAMRPHSEKYTVSSDGKRPHHQKTVSFFSVSNIYNAPEYCFREGGHKWEPCIRNSRTFLAKSLKDPCFDIYYHQRENGGRSDATARPIPYALVVGIKAKKIDDLYNRVVRTYAGILVPIRPQVRIPT